MGIDEVWGVMHKTRPRWQSWFDDYVRFLEMDRGLSPSAQSHYGHIAERYLAWQFRRRPVNWRRVRPQDLWRYVRRLRWPGRKAQGLNSELTALRQFLRFVHLRGGCTVALAEAVPTVSGGSRSLVRPALSTEHRRQLLACFDRHNTEGARDYAMARCMTDLGLRCVEVARLGLHDLDDLGRSKMPSLCTRVRQYLAHRRAMGYVLTAAAQRLPAFARYAQRRAPGQPLTTALALQWATARPGASRSTHAKLLGLVRGLARFCAVFDPRTAVPGTHLLGPTCQRVRPHLFTAEQIRLILRRAGALSTRRSPLQPRTYETLIGLLACTGLRPGEARHLRWHDLDSATGPLRIAPCKASPERMIPLHPTTVRALQRYWAARRRYFPGGDHWFVGTTGQPLRARKTEMIFARLAQGIPSNGQRLSLRLVDFRHTFASHWIAQWSRQAQPVSHHLLLLARYLGHRHFGSTWWYVSSDPQTLQAAARTFRRFHVQARHP